MFNRTPKPAADNAVAKVNEQTRQEDKESHPKPDSIPARKTISKAEPPPPITPKEKTPTPIAPVTPTVPIAPAPRAVPLNRPPEGFTTKWERRGGVQTRIVGATITFPTLTDDTHREFPSRSAVLLVWVETQNLTATGVSLRRWLNPLNEYAKLTNVDNVRIKPAMLPAGARVGGQLEGSHSLPPGSAIVTDVLAFEVPSSATRNLFLTLDASHVTETGNFVHVIPYDVWSKK